jgi:hypothetical protein
MIAMPTPIPEQRPFCAPTVQGWYQLHENRYPRLARDGILHLTVSTVGSHAFVSWTSVNMGGNGLFAKRGDRWCVLANTGGPLSENEIIGTDGITAREAHRLFHATTFSTFGIKP